MGPIWQRKKKDQKGKRSAVRQKQSIQGDSINRRHSVKFINKPLSNFELLDWVKKLKIKHFRGIYSRDNLPQKMKKMKLVSLTWIDRLDQVHIGLLIETETNMQNILIVLG